MNPFKYIILKRKSCFQIHYTLADYYQENNYSFIGFTLAFKENFGFFYNKKSTLFRFSQI